MSSEAANPMEDRQTDDAVSVSADEVGFRIKTGLDYKQTVFYVRLAICILMDKWQFRGGDFETQFASRFELLLAGVGGRSGDISTSTCF